MKYTIEGFSQEELLKYHLDCADACLLRFIVDFIATGKMDERRWDEVSYYWFKYTHVLEQMPILGLSSADALARRLRKLVDAGVLMHQTRKDRDGTRSYYCLSDEGATLLFSRTPPTQKSDPTRPKSRSIDSSISDTSITDKEKKAPPALSTLDTRATLQAKMAKAEAEQNIAAVLMYGLELMAGHPFSSYPKEWRSAKAVADKIRTVANGTPPLDFLRALVKAFVEKRRSSKQEFWSEAPLAPSSISVRFDQLLGCFHKKAEEAEGNEALREMLAKRRGK